MLITRVNKSLHWVSIDLAVDVEHNHLSEAFWGLLHRNVHIFLHVVLPGILKKGKYWVLLRHGTSSIMMQSSSIA